MNKYFIIASDERSYLDVINVVQELKKRKLPYFFLYSRGPHRISPAHSLNKFNYDSNLEETDNSQGASFTTLGCTLPFTPTHLITTNENWEPEKTILQEFKTKGCFIACIDNSTWLRSGIKGKLELGSRKNYPSNCIDIYFEHSTRCKEIKMIGGMYPHQSIVVGNPRNDSVDYTCTTENIAIVYGSMEREHHSKIVEIYRQVVECYKDWEVYYKPHPNEVKEFPNDFENINVIGTYEEYFKILPKSNLNIGIFGSVMYFPLLLKKTVVPISFEDAGVLDEEDIENYRGHEYNFWSSILNFKSFEDFKDYIGLDFMRQTKEINLEIDKILQDNLEFYSKSTIFKQTYKNNINILRYFDEFNDRKASSRIINYLEGEQ